MNGLGGDDAGGKPALHVTGAAAIDAAVPDLATEGIGGPAMPNLDHVDMGVEMHAGAGARALAAGDDIPARMPVAVADRARRADQLGMKTRAQAAAGRDNRRSRGSSRRAGCGWGCG